MTKLICLGEIVAAHGIKGQVKIKTFTETPTNITAYGALHDGHGKTYKLVSPKMAGPFSVIASIAGVSDRNQAEAMRGIKLFIERDQLPAPSENEYYHEDLMGMAVVDQSGKNYGVIVGLQDFGAGVFFDIKSDDTSKMATLPMNQDAVLSVDLERREMCIDPEFLLI
jgi:16S rRNA processing protein RimM